MSSGIFQFRNPYTTPRTKKRRRREKPAQLLRVERREIHGQLVDVQIWSEGPSPTYARNPADANKSGEEMAEAGRLLGAEVRTEYTPRKELAYIGIPASPYKDLTNWGGEKKADIEDSFNPSVKYD